jgi:virginiamycin A acetyltransferase
MNIEVDCTDEMRTRFRGAFVEVSRPGRFWVNPDTRIEPPFTFVAEIGHDNPLRLGAFSYTNSAFYGRPVTVGRYCSIASGLHFGQIEHPTHWLTTSNITYSEWASYAFAKQRGAETRQLFPLPLRETDITIGHDVWIGQNVYLKSGVTIGHGAIIGAHAVVTKDVPPYAIVGGVPARLIRYRFDPALIERLLRVQWWRFAFTDLTGVDLTDPARALDVIEEREAKGELQPYAPVWLRLGDLVGQAAP